MDSIKKIGNAICHGGLLGLGLLGLYLSHRKVIPEYICYVSCCLTCVGLYDLSLYLIEDNYAESEDDKDEATLIPQNRSESVAFGAKSASPRKRKISRQEFDKVVDKILPDFSSRESKNLPMKIGLPILKLTGENALENPDLEKFIEQVKKEDISIRISPIKMKVFDNKTLDIPRIPLSEQSDIIDRLRLKLTSRATEIDEPH